MAHNLRGEHAIVIGASIGGLLAARALADHYEEVTIFERDELPEADAPRKGVPQGRHTHGLLARGREVLEQLFPGFTQHMVAEGAISGDIVNDVLWFNHGCYLATAPSKLIGLGVSRPLLEGSVRRRLLRLPNIRLRTHCYVLEPVFHREDRVTGVRVIRRSTAAATIGADLVVDASGRGSLSPAWLATQGYGKPRLEQIEVNISYATREYRRRPGHLHGKTGAVLAACRPDWRFGVILAQEHECGRAFFNISPSCSAAAVPAAKFGIQCGYNLLESDLQGSPRRQQAGLTRVRTPGHITERVLKGRTTIEERRMHN